MRLPRAVASAFRALVPATAFDPPEAEEATDTAVALTELSIVKEGQFTLPLRKRSAAVAARNSRVTWLR